MHTIYTIYTIYTQYIHNIYTVIYNIYTIYTIYTTYTQSYTIYTQHIHNIYTGYTQYAHTIYNIYTIYTQYLSEQGRHVREGGLASEDEAVEGVSGNISPVDQSRPSIDRIFLLMANPIPPEEAGRRHRKQGEPHHLHLRVPGGAGQCQLSCAKWRRSTPAVRCQVVQDSVYQGRHIQGTFRQHSGTVQFELRWTPVSSHPNCKKHLKKVPQLTQNTTCPHGYLRPGLT
jgi:hypothetical protein